MAGSGREYVWQGQLDRYDGLGLDERTRTAACRVVVDQPRQVRPADRGGPPALMRGMYVSIRIQVAPQTPLLEIPESSLRPGNVVWRVRSGELAIVPVHFVAVPPPDSHRDTHGSVLVHVSGPGGQVSDRLQPGDQVVISPLAFVRTGMKLQVTAADEVPTP